MQLTEISNVILGNVELPKAPKYRDMPDYAEDIKKVLPLCEGLYNPDHFNQTFSYVEFYTANPMLDAFLSDWHKDARLFKKEFFYSILCGTYVSNVPTELLALFVVTKRSSVSPNQMISAIDKSKFKKYLTQQTSSNKRYMKEILDTLWGYDVSLVTKELPIVTNGEVVEIYIENINDILLCNKSIRDILPDVEDVKSLWYSKDKGIVLGTQEIPLRTLIQRYGIVKNDLDLREVFLANES